MTRKHEKNSHLHTLSVRDLRRRAAALGIVGRSRMTRAMLLQAVRSAQSDTPNDVGERSSSLNCAPPAEPTAPPYLDRGRPIPDTYGDDRLCLMIPNATKGYVYWELSGPVTERFMLAYGDDFLDTSRWYLRVRSLRAREVDDRPVTISSYRCYVDLTPGRLYEVQLGFLDEEGSFVPVLKSVPKTTPVDTVSSIVDEEWPIPRSEMVGLSAKTSGALPGDSQIVWNGRFEEIADQRVPIREES